MVAVVMRASGTECLLHSGASDVVSLLFVFM